MIVVIARFREVHIDEEGLPELAGFKTAEELKSALAESPELYSKLCDVMFSCLSEDEDVAVSIEDLFEDD